MKTLLLIVLCVLGLNLGYQVAQFNPGSQAPPEIAMQVPVGAEIPLQASSLIGFSVQTVIMQAQQIGGDIADFGLSIALPLLLIFATLQIIRHAMTETKKRRLNDYVPDFNPHTTEIRLT